MSLVLHADKDFLPGERLVIHRAMQALAQQTAGQLEVYATYDLDFENSARIEALSKDAWLVRAESRYPQIMLVDMSKGTSILGVTMIEPKVHQPQIYLVADRLLDMKWFQHVVMHEMLHAVGLRDIESPGSVMTGAVCQMVGDLKVCEVPTCMSPSDAAEACRVWHCQPSQLNACPWG